MLPAVPVLAWWCSARGLPWEWRWQPYPGIWAWILLLEGTYLAVVLMGRRSVPESERPHERRQIALYTLGVLAVWATADWPIGTLGAGYLASAHMVEYLTFTFVAGPLMVLGLPAWLVRRALRPGIAYRGARLLTHPIAALIIVNAILLITHLPALTDALLRMQLGNMVMDMLWLGAGLLLWWPILGPLPEFNHLSQPLAIGYLFLLSLVPALPASLLTFSPFPFYNVYERAPRVWIDLSATTDQQIAGLLMKLVGGFIILGAIAVEFFRWWWREEQEEPHWELRWDEVQQELVDLGVLTEETSEQADGEIP